MRVEYAPRATADLAKIGRRSRRVFGDAVGCGDGNLHSCDHARVVPLVRYLFKIFYTISEEAITILHIRHTSRRAWSSEDEE